jgi:hypothetical protein
VSLAGSIALAGSLRSPGGHPNLHVSNLGEPAALGTAFTPRGRDHTGDGDTGFVGGVDGAPGAGCCRRPVHEVSQIKPTVSMEARAAGHGTGQGVEPDRGERLAADAAISSPSRLWFLPSLTPPRRRWDLCQPTCSKFCFRFLGAGVVTNGWTAIPTKRNIPPDSWTRPQVVLHYLAFFSRPLEKDGDLKLRVLSPDSILPPPVLPHPRGEATRNSDVPICVR